MQKDLNVFLEDPENYSVTSGNVECVFRNVKQRLIELIKGHAGKSIVGCVAWLTDPEILETLAHSQCSIIVQKEDFLRPDEGGSKSSLRRSYDLLDELPWHKSINQPGLGLLSDGYNTHAGWIERSAIRCVGNYNQDKNPAFPRMHNKFLVFCDQTVNPKWTCTCDKPPKSRYHKDECGFSMIIRATSVWTGSLNLTRNAGFSLENGVHVTDPIIAGAYLNEWSQILGMSELLDWTSNWVAPEFRLGT